MAAKANPFRSTRPPVRARAVAEPAVKTVVPTPKERTEVVPVAAAVDKRMVATVDSMAHAITATVVATFMFMLKKRKIKIRMNTISKISGNRYISFCDKNSH